MLWRVLGMCCTGIVLLATHVHAAAFALNTTSSNWVITTGAGLVVTMRRTTCDITSLLFNGKELQYKAKYTHLNSGLGTVKSSALTTFKDSKYAIKIVCSITGLTQYYYFRANENTIYMGTYHTDDLELEELRFLARFTTGTMATGPRVCMIANGTAIEADDVFQVSTETRSKYYSGVPFIDDNMHTVSGSAGAAYMVMPELAYETSSGGPFFRDINTQIRPDVNEFTFYMKSDHSRTEDYRYGFHGPYALTFTSGSAPTGLNFTFMQNQTMSGFVPDLKRGRAKGIILDPNCILTGSEVIVHFYNAAAQYWTPASSLSFTSPLMKPGSYKVLIYKKELVVGSGTVTVKAGTTTTAMLTVSFAKTIPIWRIGDWDGTPEGFLNADKIHSMHPSDARMSAWKNLTYVVGTTKDASFPMAQFRGVNDISIRFNLTSSQASTTRTLRIGVTIAHHSATPIVIIDAKRWTSAAQNSVQVATRGLTRGVTHGNFNVYSIAIPKTALVTGTNTIHLGISSDEVDSPKPFLRASIGFDALELV